MLVDDQPEAGVVGYTVLPTSARAVGTRLVHFVYGAALTPEIRLVESVRDIEAWLRDHPDGHPKYRANATQLKQIGLVCFCQAPIGRSQVIRIPVEKTRHADPHLMASILRTAPV